MGKSKQNCAFKVLKESLEDAKTIAYWKQFRKTRLTVDVSWFALGAILKQKLEHSDVCKVVAYASSSLTTWNDIIRKQIVKHLLFGTVSIFIFFSWRKI